MTLDQLRKQLDAELNYHVRKRLQKQIADAERKEKKRGRPAVVPPIQPTLL